MKIIELTNKLMLPITNEEADLISKFVDSDEIYKSELNEREQVVANNLVVKGAIERSRKDGKVKYNKSR